MPDDHLDAGRERGSRALDVGARGQRDIDHALVADARDLHERCGLAIEGGALIALGEAIDHVRDVAEHQACAVGPCEHWQPRERRAAGGFALGP